MLVAGLTGGIASGKNSVSMVFKELGAKVIDADKICRELVRPETPAWHEIKEYFGGPVLKDDFCINRKKLGDMVFHDAEKRKALNSILHPKVISEEKRQLEVIRKEEPHSIVIINAALLIESGNFRDVDVVILVTASKETMMSRVMKRDRISKSDALLRIKAQMPTSEKLKYADYVIENNGAMTELREKAANLYELLEEKERLARFAY